jgi:F5/8 type C domain
MDNFKNKRKYLSLAAVVLFILSCGFVFIKNAKAQMQVNVVVDATATKQQIQEKVDNALMDNWRYATIMALTTALNTASETVAKNMATWLASGGAAQGPMAWLKSLGDISEQSFENAASDFLNTLTVKFTGYGLCQPVNPQITLNIKLGIFRDLQPPKPKCTWSQMIKNYDTMKSTLASGAFLQNFAVAFQPAQNDIDNALALHYAARNEANKTANLNILDATKAGGFKDVTSYISGDVKTPASMVHSQVDTTFDSNSPSGKQAQYNSTVSYTSVAKSVLSGIAANAGRMFLNTLATKIVDKYTKGGMFSLATIICKTRLAGDLDLCKKNGASGVSDTVTTGANAVALASAYYAAIFAPTPSTDSSFSLIGDLQACPAGAARNIYNCAIDEQFANLLQKQSNGGYLTVDEALQQSLLADNPIIGKGNPEDGQSDCYTKGYCYSNLRKLRRADIIPVGWEMAAAEIGTKTGVTLSQVEKGFNDCNASGALDADHPYCHLIDPDWVLKIPLEQCNALVNGQTVTGANSPERAQTCADITTCISEDQNGKCVGGYGYCTRETGGWSVDADSCPAQYASCESYTKANLAENESDTTGDWLSNTLDSKSCSATTAGCRAFSVSRNKGNWVDGTRLYLTTSAPVCEATDAGCKAFQDAATTTTQNLIPNPSFETPRADKQMAAGWTSLGGSYVQSDAEDSFDGTAAFHVVANGGLKLGGYNWGNLLDSDHYSEVQVQPKSLYTLSFYVKSGTGKGNGNLIMKAFDSPFYGPQHNCTNISYTDSSGNHQTSGPFASCLQDMTGDVGYLPTCTTTLAGGNVSCGMSGNHDFGYSANNSAFVLGFPLSGGYERYTMTFGTSSNTHYLDFAFGTDGVNDYYIDAVQLELGSAATPFHVGGSDISGAKSYFKAPPDYLNCTGDKTNDDPECNKYATVCRETEAGCDGYTPAGGGARIPGIVGAGDACPATCVGYNTFKQESTQWEVPATDASRFPVYFIPATGKTCSLTDVGCDEFTSLEQAAAGGETKDYFTFLRACRKSDPTNEATFFIWEGSDASGYQLKSYVLRTGSSETPLRMDVFDGTAEGDTKPSGGPAYVVGTTESSCTSTIVNLPATDPNYNPDCHEFIDAAGDRYYRLLTRTISSTDDCNNFRKTTSTQTDCEGTGGVWNNDTCEYEGLPAESITCQSQFNGCRLYTGNNGANTETVLSEDFENGSNGWSGGLISGEATVVGGHSFAVSGINFSKSLTGADGTSIIKKGKSYTLTVWAKGKGSFYAGITSPDGTTFHYFNGDQDKLVSLTSDWQRYVVGPLFVDWAPQNDSVLNIYLPGLAAVGNGAINFDYFDNINLVATTDQFALVKDSWKTPAECDETADGTALAQAQLGCAAYTNTEGKTVDLKSFTNLCRDNVIGCKAYIDTAGTTSPFVNTYNARCSVATPVAAPTDCVINNKTFCTISANATYCRFNQAGVLPPSANGFTVVADSGTSAAPDLFTVPADSVRYYVAADINKCEQTAVGCTELGGIAYGTTATCTLSANCTLTNGCACTVGNSILETKTSPAVACFVAKGSNSCLYSIDPNAPTTSPIAAVYRIVKPDNFSQGDLCTSDAVGCDAWTAGDNTTQYFKNPASMLCEYKTGVSVGTAQANGWFKKGTSEPCDPKYLVAGSDFGIHRNLDNYFADFAGVCTDDSAGCTEYRDPFDLSVSGGKPYFFINNSKITDASAACDQGASNKKGCILFDDQSNPDLPWSSVATYDDSTAHNFNYRPGIPAPAGAAVAVADPSVNLALGGTASQIDTGYGLDAHRAIDGNTLGSYADANKSFTHTTGSTDSDWWQVDLGKVYAIGLVKIFNREDCCRDRLNDFDVMLSKDGGNTWTNSQHFAGPVGGSDPPNDPLVVDFGGALGEIVRVQLTAPRPPSSDPDPKNYHYLSLAEVEVFSTASVTPPEVNDSNIILQAQLDRQCTDWLECNSWETVKNPSTGQSISQCLGLGDCTQKDSAGNCLAWQGASSTPLNINTYSSRPVIFGAADYTGYSVPDMASLAQGTQVLATPTGGGAPVRDFKINVSGGMNGNIAESCKSYPEATSPFPADAAPVGANVCEKNDKTPSGRDCECSYRKVTYGATEKYFEPTAEAGVTKDFAPGEIPSAICTDGSYIGQDCSVYASGDRTGLNQSCSNGTDEGTCTAVSKVDSFLGGEGYCLESDDSVTAAPNGPGACLTWLPIDQPNGRDPNSLSAAAGFLAKPGQEAYCAAPLQVCVPTECGNNYHNRDFSQMVPPICTMLYDTSLTGATQGCFKSCGGDTNCEGSQDLQCAYMVASFCNRIGGGGGMRATGTITIVNVPSAGKTVTIGPSTFMAGATGNYGFSDAGDINATASSLAAAISSQLIPATTATANGNIITLTANISGSAFNLPLSTNDPADITFSGSQMITVVGSKSFNGKPDPASNVTITAGTQSKTFTEGTDFTATPGNAGSTAASLSSAIINSTLAQGKGAPLGVSYAGSGIIILTPNQPQGSTAPTPILTISTNDSASYVLSGTSMTGGTSGTSSNSWCGDAVTSYPECATFNSTNPADPGNTTYCLSAYNACIDYLIPRQAFCAEMSTDNCTTNYGGNPKCSTVDVTNFCGPYKVDSCSSSGKLSDGKFCGNGQGCGVGEECKPVNDLTAHQTEYTAQEVKEGAVVWYTGEGGYDYITGNWDEDSNMYFQQDYNAIPDPGAHTYLTSVELAGLPVLSSDALVFKPEPPAEGVQNDWAGWNGDSPINVSPEADKTTKVIQSYPNDLIGMFDILSPADHGGHISIDYDLTAPSLLFASQVERATFRVLTYQDNGLGRYGIGSPYGPDANGSDLTQWIGQSNVIKHKQIARNPQSPATGGTYPCGKDANGKDVLCPYPAGLYDDNNGSYGYWLFNAGDDWQFNTTKQCAAATVDNSGKQTPGACTTSNTAPYDFVLTNGDGWTAQASSGEGELTISLRLSDSEPKRIIGVHIDAQDTDESSHGYFYLSNIDFKIVGDQSGAICGETAYAGSSNPLSEDNTNTVNNAGAYGLAKTTWMNSNTINTANDTNGNPTIKYASQCSPWGAFAIANPSTIVTSASSNCEISKAAIYNGITELLKVFARIIGVGLFNDDVSTRDDSPSDYFTYINTTKVPGNNYIGPAANGLITGLSSTPKPPSISEFTLNGAGTGYLPGRGSLHTDLKFFAWADPDQLPLKNVKIYWGGAGSADYYDSGSNNFYKNRKDPCAPTGPSDTADNCDSSPFDYSHVYSCTPQTVNFAADRNYPEIGLLKSDTNNACKFTPRISVTDNWNQTTTTDSPVSIIVAPN